MTDSFDDSGFSKEIRQFERAIDDLQHGKQFNKDDSVLEDLLPTLQLLVEAGQQEKQETQDDQFDTLQNSQLGDYQILREVGRGGMGLVFEAVENSLHRRVALKVLSFSAMHNPETLARFEREAHAAANLEHPRIVRAYARGEDRGIYYLAMQYIEGQDLSRYIRERRAATHKNVTGERSESEASSLKQKADTKKLLDSLTEDGKQKRLYLEQNKLSESEGETCPLLSKSEYFREIAQIAQQAAEALQYAHENQVIHRDIKPSNLLLDHEKNVFIADFGLASLGSSGDLTTSGTTLGTLRYSSPEQAQGSREIDSRCDIYSLGLTLYELATLSPAFSGEKPMGLLHDILEKEPTRPRKIEPAIPEDLESIIIKAISKDPQHRYQTALELAFDLNRFLRNEPVLAKRPTVIERGLRWIQRNRLVSLLSLAVVLLIVLGVAGVFSHFTSQNEILVELDQTNSKLSLTLEQEQQLRQTVAEEARLAEERFYAADMASIMQLTGSERAENIIQRLQRHVPQQGQSDHRDFLWFLLNKKYHQHAKILKTHKNEVVSMAFAPGLNTLATGDLHGTIVLWNTNTWQQQGELTFYFEVRGLVFSPDEKMLAIAGTDGLIQIYQTSTWKLQKTFRAHDMTIMGLVFTPDGKNLVSGSREGDIAFWETVSWQEKRRFTAHNIVTHLSVSKDGQWLASCGKDSRLRAWDISTGEMVVDYEDRNDTLLTTAFSDNSLILATGGYENQINLVRRLTGKRFSTIYMPGTKIRSCSFLNGNDTIMVGTFSGEIYLYDFNDSNSGRLILKSKLHDSETGPFVFLEDRDQLVTASDDTTVRVTTLPGINLGKADVVAPAASVKFSPDGESFALAHQKGTFATYDRTGKQIASYTNTDMSRKQSFEEPPELAFADNSSLWAANVDRNNVYISVVSADNKVRTEIITLEHPLEGVWLSNNAQFAFTADAQLQGAVWELATLNRVYNFDIPEKVSDVAYSNDNSTVALVTKNGEAFLYHLTREKSIQLVAPSLSNSIGLHTVCFNPSGTLIAAGSKRGLIYLWDVLSGRLIHELDHQPDTFHQSPEITSILFAKKGTHLISAGSDLRVWNAESGQLLGQFGKKYYWSQSYECLAFSPNQDCLVAVATQSENGNFHIWDVRESFNQPSVITTANKTSPSAKVERDME